MAEFRDFYEESEKMADYLLKAIDSSTLKIKSTLLKKLGTKSQNYVEKR